MYVDESVLWLRTVYEAKASPALGGRATCLYSRNGKSGRVFTEPASMAPLYMITSAVVGMNALTVPSASTERNLEVMLFNRFIPCVYI